MKKVRLFLDFYYRRPPVLAYTLKELQQKVGPGRVSRLYVDRKLADGLMRTYHVGYNVGQFAYLEYQPVERPVDRRVGDT